jgi:hypothetical protein
VERKRYKAFGELSETISYRAEAIVESLGGIHLIFFHSMRVKGGRVFHNKGVGFGGRWDDHSYPVTVAQPRLVPTRLRTFANDFFLSCALG